MNQIDFFKESKILKCLFTLKYYGKKPIYFLSKFKKRDNIFLINIIIGRSCIILLMDICHQIKTNNSIQHSFQQFTISLTFHNTPNKVAQINLINNSTLQSYRADVNSTFIAQNQDLKKYFQDPGELYKFLSNIIDEIMVGVDGELRFQLKVHGFEKGKLLTIKTTRIFVQKQTIFQKQYQNIRKQVKQTNQIVCNLTSSIKKLEQKNTILQQNLTDSIKKIKILQSYQKLGFHPHNSHCGNYMQKRLQKSIIITKITKDQTNYRFVNAGQIFQNTIRSYRVRLIHVPKGWLSLGFCDREFFMSKNFHHQSHHFLNYGCDGIIHQNGSSKQAAVASVEGEVIICTVDLTGNRNKVIWKKNNFLIAERMLPECMRNRSLYFASVTCMQWAAYEVQEIVT